MFPEAKAVLSQTSFIFILCEFMPHAGLNSIFAVSKFHYK